MLKRHRRVKGVNLTERARKKKAIEKRREEISDIGWKE